MNWDWKITAIAFCVTLAYKNVKTFIKSFRRGQEDDNEATVFANAVMDVIIIVFIALIP